MAFPNEEMYNYGQPTDTQTVLVRTTIVPVIEIVQTPASITNSLQARFVLRVIDGELDLELPSAILYYRLGFSNVDISIGTDREVTIPVTSGNYEIIFSATFNGVAAVVSPSYSWMVDTTRPIIAPGVSAIQPANGSVGIGINTAITIEFSENMKVAETIAALVISPSVAGSWSGSGKLFSYIKTSPLAYNQAYSVTIGTGAQDLAGNSLATPYTFNFTTSQAGNQAPDAPNFVGLSIPARTSNSKPVIPFNVPLDVDNDTLHFVVEIASNSSFTMGFLTYNTINHPNMFTYYGNAGTKVEPFPSTGVAAGVGQVIFKTPVEFSDGQYWFRFFADDRRM